MPPPSKASLYGTCPAATDSNVLDDLNGQLYWEQWNGSCKTGEDVWDGILDAGPAGTCTQQFQVHRSPRIVAGGPIEGGIFQCALKSVAQAIADGDYGSWSPSAAEQARLMQMH